MRVLCLLATPSGSPTSSSKSSRTRALTASQPNVARTICECGSFAASRRWSTFPGIEREVAVMLNLDDARRIHAITGADSVIIATAAEANSTVFSPHLLTNLKDTSIFHTSSMTEDYAISSVPLASQLHHWVARKSRYRTRPALVLQTCHRNKNHAVALLTLPFWQTGQAEDVVE